MLMPLTLFAIIRHYFIIDEYFAIFRHWPLQPPLLLLISPRWLLLPIALRQPSAMPLSPFLTPLHIAISLMPFTPLAIDTDYITLRLFITAIDAE
jgi:hypothetical protein